MPNEKWIHFLKNPSKELIDKCKDVANQFKKKYSKLVFFRF